MINLFVSYYKAATPERQAEIDYCLKANCENPLIDEIHLFVDDNTTVPEWANVNQLTGINGSPTYDHFITVINSSFLSLPEDSINIIANSDIVFDETIALTSQLKEDECWALSRWELNAKLEKIHPYNRLQIYGDSQDVWIFRGNIKPLEVCDFSFGVRGCDNRIAHEIYKAGYKISNPSNSVRTWHYHVSGVRNYIPAQGYAIPQPYLNVPITSL